MKCQRCNNEIADGSIFCSFCGEKLINNYSRPTDSVRIQKSKVAYVLLGVFLGGYGVHNFYAGYTEKAVIQLILGILCCGVISSIWAIVDVCTINCDANGVSFSE